VKVQISTSLVCVGFSSLIMTTVNTSTGPPSIDNPRGRSLQEATGCRRRRIATMGTLQIQQWPSGSFLNTIWRS
jgi:hypothetical protein